MPDAIPNAFDIVVAFGNILVVALAASAVGSEYAWGIIHVLVGSGISRTCLLAAGIPLGIGFSIIESILASVLASLGSVGETISELLLTPNIAAITRLNEFATPPLDSDASDP